MSGNVEEVDRKLRAAADGHVDLIHWLLGPNDMIVHVHAKGFKELMRVIDSRILPLKNETHNKIASAETLIVTSSKARKAFALSGAKPKELNAWVFANTNSNDPELGFRLMEDKHVFYVAHVIGLYDMVLLIRAADLPGLMSAIDKTLRTDELRRHGYPNCPDVSGLLCMIASSRSPVSMPTGIRSRKTS